MRLVFVGKGVYLEVNTDLSINLDHGLSNIPRGQDCREGGEGLCRREEKEQSSVEVEGLCRRKAKRRGCVEGSCRRGAKEQRGKPSVQTTSTG